MLTGRDGRRRDITSGIEKTSPAKSMKLENADSTPERMMLRTL